MIFLPVVVAIFIIGVAFWAKNRNIVSQELWRALFATIIAYLLMVYIGPEFVNKYKTPFPDVAILLPRKSMFLFLELLVNILKSVWIFLFLKTELSNWLWLSLLIITIIMVLNFLLKLGKKMIRLFKKDIKLEGTPDEKNVAGHLLKETKEDPFTEEEKYALALLTKVDGRSLSLTEITKGIESTRIRTEFALEKLEEKTLYASILVVIHGLLLMD